VSISKYVLLTYISLNRTNVQQLDFAVRLLHFLCPQPNIKDFEWMDKNYKAKWDLMNKLRGEVFSKEELEEMKLAGKSKKVDGPGTPGGSQPVTPKPKSSTKRKVQPENHSDDVAEDTPAKKKTARTPRGKKARNEEDEEDKEALKDDLQLATADDNKVEEEDDELAI
jgi:hypothetical protein